MEPFGITIFCDDIRQEVFGKSSLIGCYGPDLQIFGDLPTILPKLGFYICARLPVDVPVPPLRLLVYLPGDADDAPTVNLDLNNQAVSETPPMRPDIEHPDSVKHRTLIFNFVMSPVQIKQEGVILVRLMYGEQRIKIGGLKIFTQSSPAPTK